MPINPSKFYSLEEATRKLEHYCSYQDRCHREVELKLKEMNMIPQAKAQIIAHLIKEDYLNEERFARNYVRGKFNQKNWGRLRLKNALFQKGISPYLTKLALSDIPDDTYQNKFQELARRKWESLNVSNKQLKKRKVYDYLAYRGWERHLIYDQINKLSQKT